MAKAYKYERVMVIDDNHIDRIIAERALKTYGFAKAVLIMDGARKALDNLAAMQNDPEAMPQLIFVDLSMPLLSGFDFLKEYEKLPEPVRKKNIVILTSSLEATDKARAQSSPYVIKYLNKPLTADLLKGL